MFHHLCASLKGAVGQVLLDIGLCAMTANMVCLLRTRFGARLQTERFKAEIRARRRAPGESLRRGNGKCGVLHFGGNYQRLARRTISAAAELLVNRRDDIQSIKRKWLLAQA